MSVKQAAPQSRRSAKERRALARARTDIAALFEILARLRALTGDETFCIVSPDEEGFYMHPALAVELAKPTNKGALRALKQFSRLPAPAGAAASAPC